MKLTNITLTNFRCYDTLEIKLHPNFNVIVGINGTGKTAILEAIRIAIGSLFLELDKVKDKIWSPGFETSDVRLLHLERQYPVVVKAQANLHSKYLHQYKQNIKWIRSLDKHGGRTTQVQAKDMKEVSEELQDLIRKGEETTIPLIAYYSTDRFKKEKKDVGLRAEGSRLRGYYHTLAPETNVKFFLDLLKTETLSELQHDTKSPILEAVSNAVIKCIDDCKKIYFDVKRDELIIELKSINDSMPFFSLSDGVRSTLAMVMEIAFRACLLNPHLKEKAPIHTGGIVLIDEIDLHLHPTWQKKIISDLRGAFPNIQFIVTTHAPLVIGSLKDGEIFSISEHRAYNFPIQYGRDANAILKEMDTQPMAENLNQKLEEYFLLIEEGNGKSAKGIEIREYLDEKLGTGHAELQRADIMLSFFED